MTIRETRIVDNSTISEPNPTPPPPNEPPSQEDAVVRAVPDGWCTYHNIRVELKQNGGVKKFRPVNSMRDIVDAITGLGKTALVKFDINAEDNEPLLEIPAGMKDDEVFKEYFKVQIQENQAFRRINVIFKILSEMEFSDIKRRLGEYLNAENIIMHEHVFDGTKVHHCGYITGLDPSRTDMGTISQLVAHLTGVNKVQVVKGQVFYKEEDKKWTKTDLLAILSEPKDAATVSKRMIEDNSLPDRGIEYIDCRTIVYHHDFKKDIPEVVGEHKENLRKQTTITVDDALEDDELFMDMIELETIIFINKSRANKNSFIVVTTKEKREKTEEDLLQILKKPAYSRRSKVGRPYLRYNDPDFTNPINTQKEEKQQKDETAQKFDDIELEYMKRIKAKAEARRNKRKEAVNNTADPDPTHGNNREGQPDAVENTSANSQENREALEKKLAKKIRKKSNQRRRKNSARTSVHTGKNNEESEETHEEMDCDNQETVQQPDETPPTPQQQNHVKDSWEDEDHDEDNNPLSPFKTPMKNLLGKIEEENDMENLKEKNPSENPGKEDMKPGLDDNSAEDETVKTSNVRTNKRGASTSPLKDDYAEWTPAKRFVPQKKKQVRILSPYKHLLSYSDLPRKHLGRGGGGRGNLPSATSGTRPTTAGGLVRGGGI